MKKEDYKAQIVELIKNIDNEKFLFFICNMIESFIRKWGY